MTRISDVLRRVPLRSIGMTLFVIGLLFAVGILGGCATAAPQNKDYAAYLAAAQSASSRPVQPILRMRAIAGQTIELRGVDLFEVYAPQAANAGVASIALPPRQEPHPAWAIASQLVGVAGAFLPSYSMGKWMNALAGTVGNANSTIASGAFTSLADIAGHIQAPTPNITIGGNGVVGSGTLISTVNHADNGSVAGGGRVAPSTVTTTTSDSQNHACTGGAAGTTGDAGAAGC